MSTLVQLPALGAPLEGGSFAGITTKPDGTHCAVVLLPAQSPDDLDWIAAKAWAAEQGGELPRRPVTNLLFANVRAQLRPRWHWTADEESPSSAWGCHFNIGYQINYNKGYEGGGAVAVRLIPLAA